MFGKKKIKNILIPNSHLNYVKCVYLKNKGDFDEIPDKGGCYWIWTTEPILHSLHKRKNPHRFNGGEIIYNGIAKDNVNERIKHHLFGDIDAGWSGISLDILTKTETSHRKKAMSNSGKVPYFKKEKIRTKNTLLKLNLSKDERKFVNKSRKKIIYFRNGINIFENKHKIFVYKVYFIVGLKSLSYIEFIEKSWRIKYGQPKLCSYLSGR